MADGRGSTGTGAAFVDTVHAIDLPPDTTTGVSVGAPSRQPHRVLRLSDPARVVVDIAHP